MTTKNLHCAECHDMFEVSSEIAEAMHRWRAQSGEPFTCGACAGVAEIHGQEDSESTPLREKQDASETYRRR